MSNATKFKFVSPGIFVNEIDNSQIPAEPDALGPVIIGRTERGPALIPTKVHSFEEFVNVFGAPIATEPGNDVWRDGNRQGPTYASYAAQAWLASGEAPCTVVRLLGGQSADAGAAGQAGWTTENASFDPVTASNGGAYGLWLIDSGAASLLVAPALTGTLAAIWYINKGAMTLSGTTQDAGTRVHPTAAAGVMVESLGNSFEFKAKIYDNAAATVIETNFNFDRDSDKYVRKVFNTNPQRTNTQITVSGSLDYWLGPVYNRAIRDTLAQSATGKVKGVLLPLAGGTSQLIKGSDFRAGYREATSGWVFSSDITDNSTAYRPSDMQKLFRFIARDAGNRAAEQFKISIANVRPSTTTDDVNPFGTFDIQIRSARDTDNAPKIIEQFTNCDLNPNSLNYIARKIGDRYTEWDDGETRFRYYGNFDNVSKYIRVLMDADVDAGRANSKCLPFGNYGPARFNGWSYVSGNGSGSQFIGPYGGEGWTSTNYLNSLVLKPSGNVPFAKMQNPVSTAIDVGIAAFTGSFKFPKLALRVSASDGGISNPRNAYFGMQNTITSASTKYDEDYVDYVRTLPVDVSSLDPGTFTEFSYIFSLDDVIVTGSTNNATAQAYWSSGSRSRGVSYTATNDSTALLETAEYDSFTIPLFGGFDGLDITEVEPFRNTLLDDTSDVDESYSFYSVRRAIRSIADPEEFEFNLAAMPNIQNESLTAELIKVCEDRGDALAIIDLNGDYLPSSENTSDAVSRRPNLSTTISNLRSRGINSSYGCCFYPYVQIRDNINGAILDCPPSVVALGTFGSSQKASKLWFAPAGFNRGGLSQGAAGIPVVGVKQRLNSKDRDKLYAANINPIATFPSEGIVVFGQKTLQITPSALDRINVRRLLIFVKKEISRIAATILFDQNVEVTWNRFKSAAERFLTDVKSGLGLTEFKVVLDSTTTTPDLIDRNALYAKIFLKPARSIEFIAIDFVVTRTGASFED